MPLAVSLALPAAAGRLMGRRAANPATRVFVPGGPFTMSNDPGTAPRDESPARRPEVGPSWIDRHEVTNREYAACEAAGRCTPPAKADSKTRHGYHTDPRFAEHPVVHVTWFQAQAYCRYAKGRLPTEAEWEKAARGDRDERRYPWGDRKPDCTLANFGGPDGCAGDTDRVGARPAGKSPYGAHDMAGNVWEWTGDWYDSGYYPKSPARNPKGPKWGAFKVMRGGCFDSGPKGPRVTCRNRNLPTAHEPNVGFRCVRPKRGS